jgi:hypothetical protein
MSVRRSLGEAWAYGEPYHPPVLPTPILQAVFRSHDEVASMNVVSTAEMIVKRVFLIQFQSAALFAFAVRARRLRQRMHIAPSIAYTLSFCRSVDSSTLLRRQIRSAVVALRDRLLTEQPSISVG